MLADIWSTYGEAVLWMVGGTAIGFAIDRMLFRFVDGRAEKSKSRMMHALAAGVLWLPTWLGFVFGAWAGIRTIPMSGPDYQIASLGPRIVLILLITSFTARILGRLVGALTARDDVPLPSGSIFANLVRATVWVLGGLWVLTVAGVSVAPLITALGVGGLAVGLALQPTLENLFSGIQLVSSGQIKPGDYIRLDNGDEGVVLDVTWRNTTVQKPSNDIAVVPNAVLARATVTNFTTVDPEFVLVIPVSFASAGDPDVVERLALEVANEVIAQVPEAIKGQTPGANFAELTPPAAVLNVTIRCRSYQDRIPVRHEFVRRLAKRFATEGVEAPPVPLQSAAARR